MGIRGICPIAPAVFDERGALDLEDYRRCCERIIYLLSHLNTVCTA